MDATDELKSLIALVSNVTDSFTTALFQLDPGGESLSMVDCHSLTANIDQERTFAMGQGLIGLVADQQQALNISNFRHDSQALLFYTEREDIKSFMAVPVGDDPLEGVLSVDSKRQFTFTDKDQKILAGFAREFARAMRRARNSGGASGEQEIKGLQGFCRTISSSRRLAGVLDAMVHAPASLVPHSGLAVVLATGERGRYEVRRAAGCTQLPEDAQVSLRHSLCGWVLSQRQPLLIPRLKGNIPLFFQGEPRVARTSFLGVPLSVGDELLGVYCLIGEVAFEPYHLERFSLLATQASTALAQALLHQRLMNLRNFDPLTRIANHGFLLESIEFLVNKARGESRKFTIILVDPDDFAQVNRNFSFRVGDELLREFAMLLKRLAGREGLVGRYDMGSFLVLLDDTGADNALKLARTVKKAIEETVFQVEHQQARLTASIGLATYPEQGETAAELLDALKLAVEHAKNSGGNQVVQFS